MSNGLEISLSSKKCWTIELDRLTRCSGLLSQQGTSDWEEGGSKHRIGRTRLEERGQGILEGSFCQVCPLVS